MNNPLKDERYKVAKEFTGHYQEAEGLKTGQRYVSRFCGEYIDASKTENEAWITCIIHDDERTIKIL